MSAWIIRRKLSDGSTSFIVRYRVGGREARQQHAGAFRTKKEALARRDWVAGEIAAMRVPDLRLLEPAATVPSLREIADRWRRSRIDVRDGTATTHVVNLGRILPTLGDRPYDTITVADVTDLVAELHDERGLSRESIRKTRSTLAMVLDFAGVEKNPARDRSVKLPRDEPEELTPPTAAHVLAVYPLLSSIHRLALFVLDACGMRVGELDGLLWGDVDEPAQRWRVRREIAKTGRPRWVPFAEFPARPLDVFDAVTELVPRDDRDIAGQVLAGFGADRFRTALARACKAAGVPAFSPHDLRHRRATLWHMGGVPAVQAAAWLGHSPTEHVRTYAHATLTDRSEISYSDLLVTSGASTGGARR